MWWNNVDIPVLHSSISHMIDCQSTCTVILSTRTMTTTCSKLKIREYRSDTSNISSRCTLQSGKLVPAPREVEHGIVWKWGHSVLFYLESRKYSTNGAILPNAYTYSMDQITFVSSRKHWMGWLGTKKNGSRRDMFVNQTNRSYVSRCCILQKWSQGRALTTR